MKKAGCFFVVLLLFSSASAQQGGNRYGVCVVAFYNLENLYDTTDNPMVNDDEFTAAGSKHYSGAIYLDKLNKLAGVIHKIGTGITDMGPALLGVAEVENDTVLQQLVQHPLLHKRQYQFVHYNSKDLRGVDVALLYQPRYFRPLYSKALLVSLPERSKDQRYSRDILYVKGILNTDTVHLYINHWPSRRGGQERSIPARKAAAMVCRKHIDEILRVDDHARIIVMGDLNDDPVDKSITHILRAKGREKELKPGDLFNPWSALYQNGRGTLAHHDSWGLFDQVILSQSWLNKSRQGLFYHSQHIFNQPFMLENQGRFKGYAMRTWEGDHYRGGYSDHFPVYIILLKKSD